MISFWRLSVLLVGVGTTGCGMIGGGDADGGNGLLGHWKFDGDVSDGSGNGNHGVVKGDPRFVEGKFGMAVKLDGRSQCIEVPALASEVTEFTLAAWIHVDEMPSPPQKFSSIYHNNGWKVGDVHLPFKGPDGVMDLGIKGNEPDMSIPAFRVKDLQGRWVHLAVTYDAVDAKQVWFYLDGKPTESFKIEEANPVKLGPGRIGAWDRDKKERWFSGRIDEFALYERALPAEEVAALVAAAD